MKKLLRAIPILLLTALFALPAFAEEPCTHPVKELVSETPATCTVPGERAYVCAICGEPVTETIPAMGHDYVETARLDPTCTQPGSVSYKCSRCPDAYAEDLPAPGHDYVETAHLAPTCTEPGSVLSVCSRCGDETGEDIPALGHDYATVSTEPTCTEPGSIVYTCNRCEDTYTRTVPALGHDYAETRTEPTCTVPGSIVYICSRCEDTYTEAIPAPGHAYEKTGDTAACTAPGEATFVCGVCGDSYTEPAPALGHDYKAAVTSATCTKAGKTDYTCARCGNSYTEPTPALGHAYAETTEPATCTAAGKTVSVCARCGDTQTQILAALGHSYGDWTVTTRATYRAPGVETKFCVRGDDAITRPIPQLTHLAENLCEIGDANMDGKVDTADARLILRIAIGLDDGLDALQHKKADFDGKDGVTIKDARYTLRVCIGLDPYAPHLLPGYVFRGWTAKGYAIAEKDGMTYIVNPYGYTLIANKTYALPASYAPGDLTAECYAAFKEMADAAAKDGVNLFVVSGYRSYSLQSSLYQRYAAKDGYAAADTYSARPGHSEHQTGLAMDLNSLSSSFAYTKEGKWLAANAHKYGFIIRYPYNKQSVTGYIYEPWHVRWLGKGLAAAVYDSGLCLEEYFGITSRYS